MKTLYQTNKHLVNTYHKQEFIDFNKWLYIAKTTKLINGKFLNHHDLLDLINIVDRVNYLYTTYNLRETFDSVYYKSDDYERTIEGTINVMLKLIEIEEEDGDWEEPEAQTF